MSCAVVRAHTRDPPAARRILHADMTLSNDGREGASYMKGTDAPLTPEFRKLRLPLGTGLLSLVA
jgi:hypothetical protein